MRFEDFEDRVAGKKVTVMIHLDAIIDGQKIESDKPVQVVHCELHQLQKMFEEINENAAKILGAKPRWETEGSPKDGNYVGGKFRSKVGRYLDLFHKSEQRHLDENAEVEFEVILGFRIHNREPEVDLLSMVQAA